MVHDRGVGENGHRLKPEVQTGFKEKLFPHEDSRTGCPGRFCDLHLWRFSGCTGDCWKQEAELPRALQTRAGWKTTGNISSVHSATPGQC